jgi:hypothetical protein
MSVWLVGFMCFCKSLTFLILSLGTRNFSKSLGHRSYFPPDSS